MSSPPSPPTEARPASPPNAFSSARAPAPGDDEQGPATAAASFVVSTVVAALRWAGMAQEPDPELERLRARLAGRRAYQKDLATQMHWSRSAGEASRAEEMRAQLAAADEEISSLEEEVAGLEMRVGGAS